MKIILDNFENKEEFVIEGVESSMNIIEFKSLIYQQKNYSIDSIQLYSSNNLSIQDNDILESYLNSAQSPTKLKMKIDKSILKLLIEIYEKNIEKLSLDLSFSTSIFLLKKIVEIKTKIPFDEQMLYLNNMKLQDEDTFFELVFKNTYEREIRSKSVDRTSMTTDISSPRITKLKLLRKKNKTLSLGLDFSFNYMKNLHKMNWDNLAPSFREIEDGMSIICYCINMECILFNQMFVYNLGYGKFDIFEEIRKIYCSKCYSKKIDVKNIGFVKSEWIYKGILKRDNESRISGDGKTIDKKFHTFKEIDIKKVFDTLLIFVKETKILYETNLSVVESEESEYRNLDEEPYGKNPDDKKIYEENKNNNLINDTSLEEFNLESAKRKSKNFGQMKKMNILNNILSQPEQHGTYKKLVTIKKVTQKENSSCNIY